MNRSQLLYCNDILDRIARIEDCTAAGREQFITDRSLQDCVILAFMIIGEAVKRLDPELTSAHPNVIWSD